MIYRRPARIAFVANEVDQIELHIKSLPDGDIHLLAGSAALIWLNAIDGCSDVAARVAREMGVDPASIEKDVTGFLDRLVELQLLEPAEMA